MPDSKVTVTSPGRKLKVEFDSFKCPVGFGHSPPLGLPQNMEHLFQPTTSSSLAFTILRRKNSDSV